MLREPVVSGLFYPSSKKDLKIAIEESFLSPFGVGYIPEFEESKFEGDYPFNFFSPHAGFQYSGPAASYCYSKIVEKGFPDTFIILSPNHSGVGSSVSVYNEGYWNTPLGKIEVDKIFADNIISNSEFALSDFSAHLNEHSIEVQLPFLQYFSNNFKIVPITIGYQNMETSLDLAKSIIESSNSLSNSYSIIASTDLSHFYNQELANSLDKKVLDNISKMNYKNLFNDVKNFDITMCGYGPVITTMIVSCLTGKKQSEIFTYYTSGNITKDFSQVVGYASGIFK